MITPLAAALAAWSFAQPLCPFGMAGVPKANPRFCVDLYEGSLVEVKSDGSLSPWPYNQVPDAKTTYKAVSRSMQRPQGYISGTMAQKACQNAGKRLCTSPEWLEACQGSGKATYPYGDGKTYSLGVCNEHSKDTGYKSTLGRTFNPVDYSAKQMNDPRLNALPNGLLDAGAKTGCKTEAGAFDMVGNLHEWVADKEANGNGRFRGGYYNEAEANHSGCLYMTPAHNFDYHDYSTGFRCCADLLR